MRYFKKIIGDKCYLSPLNFEDAEKYAEWLNDFEVTRYTTISKHILSVEKEKEILKETSSGKSFAIIDKEKDCVIGNCGLSDINNIHKTAEVGIFIGDKSYWNRGYGTEAMKLILDFGFSILNLNNISLRVYEPNKGAIKSYEKCGFKIIGRRREAFIIAGKKLDEIHMDILASEYESIYFKNALKINEST